MSEKQKAKRSPDEQVEEVKITDDTPVSEGTEVSIDGTEEEKADDAVAVETPNSQPEP